MERDKLSQARLGLWQFDAMGGGSSFRLFAAVRGRLRTIATLVFVASGLSVFSQFWIDYDDEQIAIGHYEEIGGTVRVVASDGHSTTFPGTGLGSSGQLSVMPGSSVVIRLAERGQYRIENERGERGPYVVLGSVRNHVLLEASTLALAGEALQLAPWDPSRPWPEDRARLQAIWATCGRESSLRILTDGQSALFQIGRCSLSVPNFKTTAVAVVAGPDWLTVNSAGGWARRPRVDLPSFVKCLLVVAAGGWLVGQLNPVSCLISGIGLLVVSRWLPALSMIGFLLLDIIAWGWWLWHWLAQRRVGGFRFSAWWLAGTVLPLAVLLVLAVRSLIDGTAPAPISEEARCLVVGYSAVEGSALRAPRREALPSQLGTHCPPCAGHTAVRARSGETLAWIEQQTCELPTNVSVRETVFLGGSNDDLLWTGSHGAIARLFSLVKLATTPISSKRWDQLVEDGSRTSRAHIGDQLGALRATMRCVRERGSRFWLLHDYMAWDMEAGPSGDRAAMREARRATVEEMGGTFVDLFEEFHASVGVSWFNDFIHPSAIGHRRIADALCTRMTTRLPGAE